jgi:hypothetical protein
METAVIIAALVLASVLFTAIAAVMGGDWSRHDPR